MAREEAHHDRPLRRAGHDGHHHRVRRAKAVSSAASLSRDVAASETDVASQPDEEVHCTGESGGVCVWGGGRQCTQWQREQGCFGGLRPMSGCSQCSFAGIFRVPYHPPACSHGGVQAGGVEAGRVHAELREVPQHPREPSTWHAAFQAPGEVSQEVVTCHVSCHLHTRRTRKRAVSLCTRIQRRCRPLWMRY